MSVARPGFYSPIDNAFHGTGGFSEMIYDLAARTAAPATITDFYNWGAPTLVVDIHATAKTATPSITFALQRYNTAKAAWETLLTSAALTDAGDLQLVISPWVESVANVSLKEVAPYHFRVLPIHGDADSLTYAVSYETRG